MRLSLKARFVRFWEQDRGLSVLLALVLIVAFIAAPLAESRPGGGTWLRASMAILFAAGAFAVSTRPGVRALIAVLAGAPVVLGWIEVSRPGSGWGPAAALTACLFTLTIAAFVTIRVFQEGPITVHRVVGSILVYLLIGIAFGEAARSVALLHPGAYASGTFARIDRAELYHFSLVTLTTVGYGDITPVHPMARSLAALEALTGQLFPAILIARLVSQELMSRPARRSGPS